MSVSTKRSAVTMVLAGSPSLHQQLLPLPPKRTPKGESPPLQTQGDASDESDADTAAEGEKIVGGEDADGEDDDAWLLNALLEESDAPAECEGNAENVSTNSSLANEHPNASKEGVAVTSAVVPSPAPVFGGASIASVGRRNAGVGVDASRRAMAAAAAGAVVGIGIDHLFFDDTWLHLSLSAHRYAPTTPQHNRHFHHHNNTHHRHGHKRGRDGGNDLNEGGIGGGERFDRTRSKLLSAAELAKAFAAVAAAVRGNHSRAVADATSRAGLHHADSGGTDTHRTLLPHLPAAPRRPFIVRCYIHNNFGKEHLLSQLARAIGTTVLVDDERYRLATACCDPNSPDADADPSAAAMDLRYFTPMSRFAATMRDYFARRRRRAAAAQQLGLGGGGATSSRTCGGGSIVNNSSSPSSLAQEEAFIDGLPYPPCCIEVVSQSGMLSADALAEARRAEEGRRYDAHYGDDDGPEWCAYCRQSATAASGSSTCTTSFSSSSSPMSPAVAAYGVIMSGWARLKGRATKGVVEVFDIPFSLHTSPEHLIRFVAAVRPRSVTALHPKDSRSGVLMARLGRHLAAPFSNAPVVPVGPLPMRLLHEAKAARQGGDGFGRGVGVVGGPHSEEWARGGRRKGRRREGGDALMVRSGPSALLSGAADVPRGPAVRLAEPSTSLVFSDSDSSECERAQLPPHTVFAATSGARGCAKRQIRSSENICESVADLLAAIEERLL